MHRIGFLTSGSPNKAFKDRMAAFRLGLRELGYIEGKNIVIEERYGKGRHEKLAELAGKLVRLKADVIVTHGGRWAQLADRIAKKAGKTIPMVFTVDPDPVGKGIVDSLARPGGNITGVSNAHRVLAAKRLELIKEAVPTASRIAVLMHSRHAAFQLKDLQAVAPRLGVTLIPITFGTPDDLERDFTAIRKERPDALNVLGGAFFGGAFRKEITMFALENRLPVIHTNARSAKAGMLMTYGVNFPDLYRRTASFVDRILRGAKPAEMPVEQASRFYLAVNLKTAKALGITVPPSILLRADIVIE